VTAIRAEASERLWQQLNNSIDPELRCRLDALLTVEDGSRFSTLECLRTSPTRLSGPEMVKALQRVAEVRKLGAGGLDVSGVPPNRLLVLARHGRGDRWECGCIRTMAVPSGLYALRPLRLGARRQPWRGVGIGQLERLGQEHAAVSGGPTRRHAPGIKGNVIVRVSTVSARHTSTMRTNAVR